MDPGSQLMKMKLNLILQARALVNHILVGYKSYMQCPELSTKIHAMFGKITYCKQKECKLQERLKH